MSGFRRQNQHTHGLLLWTLELDGQVVDREYILAKLNRRKITHVAGLSRENAPLDVHVSDWLNSDWGGVERNYINFLGFLTIFLRSSVAKPETTKLRALCEHQLRDLAELPSYQGHSCCREHSASRRSY